MNTGDKRVRPLPTAKILQVLTKIIVHLGLPEAASEPELKQLNQETAVDLLAQELAKQIPD